MSPIEHSPSEDAAGQPASSPIQQPQYRAYKHHRYGDLRKSAKAGCAMCGLFYGRLEAELQDGAGWGQWNRITTGTLVVLSKNEIKHWFDTDISIEESDDLDDFVSEDFFYEIFNCWKTSRSYLK